MYTSEVALGSDIHIEHINSLCGQNAELQNANLGVTYSNRWHVKVKHQTG